VEARDPGPEARRIEGVKSMDAEEARKEGHWKRTRRIAQCLAESEDRR
jgi:hypothetical protein